MSQRSSVSRGQAFEDFLHAVVCSLGHPRMEEEYLDMIARHTDGPKGERGCDKLAEMFGQLVAIMDRTRQDVLGDLFQGAITYGERGQFMTPEPVCQMMARLNLPVEDTGLEGRRTVNDPCCGSGRMLTASAELQPHWHFIGQDIDLRCVRMTAINLALRNHYGHVVWGNTLAVEAKLIYETGRLQLWGNAIRKVGRLPVPDREAQLVDVTPPSNADRPEAAESVDGPQANSEPPSRQLRLF
ncbi:N-6 DNA methylase [Stratiformator vulcanicus]|uniref:N-6 DNA methylase n=1 Tax=Stratiformator vulcanicus TaxID=2527980 RepID=UPI00287778D1|nr:N-6 DNA methylase [Stratiformator vulcanicus]